MFGYQFRDQGNIFTGKTDNIEEIVKLLTECKEVQIFKTDLEDPFCDEGLEYCDTFVCQFLDAGDTLMGINVIKPDPEHKYKID